MLSVRVRSWAQPVDSLHLLHVLQGALLGFRVVGLSTVAGNTFPQIRVGDVVAEDPHTEINVILNFEEVDVLLVGDLAPGSEMNLHDSDGIRVGHGKRIGSTFDDHDAGD